MPEEIVLEKVEGTRLVEFKTIHPQSNIIIALAFAAAFFLLSYYFLPQAEKTVELIRMFGCGIASYFAARYVTASQTTVSISQQYVRVESEANLTGRTLSKEITLEEIRGYEIYKSKLFEQLILYKTDGTYILMTLTSDLENVESFFAYYFVKISSKNPLTQDSFLLATFKTLVLFTFILSIQLTLLFLSKELGYTDGAFSAMERNYAVLLIAVITISIVCFQFGFRWLRYRISGKYAYFCIVFGSIALIPTVNTFFGIRLPLTTLNSKEAIFKHKKDRFFILPQPLGINLKTPGAINHLDAATGKEKYHHLRAYFTAPVLFQDTFSHLFVGYSYEKKIPRNTTESTIELENARFLAESKKSFSKTVNTRAKFYEVVYSDFNHSFYQEDFYSSALSSYRSIVPLLIVRPHFETFPEFLRAEKEKAFFYVMIVLVLILFAVFITAFNR